jgi:hypothetical protein
MSGAVIRPALVLALALGAPVTLAACAQVTSLTQRSARAEVKIPYRTRLAREDDRRQIAVSVENRGAGLADVREAVRFEATRYCLQAFGASDAEWVLDPATGDWAFTSDGTRLTFRARCTGRG